MPNYKDEKPLKCSFCGKPQNRVRKLIAGPGVQDLFHIIDQQNT